MSVHRRLTSELQAGLTTRAVIDQAVGIIISRSGGTATEAFASLRTISQNEHTKLAVVAQRLGDEAGNCYSATSMDAFRPSGGQRDGLTIHDTMGALDRHLADLVDREALRPSILALPDRGPSWRCGSSRRRHNRKSPNN